MWHILFGVCTTVIFLFISRALGSGSKYVFSVQFFLEHNFFLEINFHLALFSPQSTWVCFRRFGRKDRQGDSESGSELGM